MTRDYILINDIVNNHRDRMENLRKYYPFFKLQENTLTQYKEGKYGELDMGYITMAVLRFFVEENNFRDLAVTYETYYAFMEELISRDFKRDIPEEERKDLIQYIFDKLCNEGKPFSFDYFDPADGKRKTSRVRLIDAHLRNGVINYEITSDAIEFYLDTKEIKEESRISVQQLLLEKMIQTENFSGGLEVIQRINSEVSRLILKKDEVVTQLSHNVFEGIKALENFSETGLQWFDEEQRLFTANKELVDKAIAKASLDRDSGQGADKYYRTLDEIHKLDEELKRAIGKHSELLVACTQLQVQADDLLQKAKYSRFRTSLDFTDLMDKIIKQDNALVLKNMVEPLFGLKLHKTLNLHKLDDMLSYKPDEGEGKEALTEGREQMYIYEDERVDARIQWNYDYMLRVLFDLLLSKGSFTLKDLNHMFRMKFSEDIFTNGDYYSFMVHLCQKKEYDLNRIKTDQDTFLEGIIAVFLNGEDTHRYHGLKFNMEFLSQENIPVTENFQVSNIRFERSTN